MPGVAAPRDPAGAARRPRRVGAARAGPEPAIRTAPTSLPQLLALPALVLCLAGCSGADAPAAPAAPAAPDRTSTAAAAPPAPTPPRPTAAPAQQPVPAPATAAPVPEGSPSPPTGRQPPATPPATGPDDPVAAPRESAPPPGLPACEPAALTVTDADAVYGPDTVRRLFTVRTSGPDCELPARPPAVQVLDAAGAPVGQVGQGGPGLPPPGEVPVTLSRGTSLSFYVQTGRDGACVPAARLEAVLAGTTAPLTAPTAMEVCDGSAAAGPLQRLATGE